MPETPGRLSDEAEDMLTRSLMKDPRERWTTAQLLQHPFFDSIEEEEEEIWMDQGIWDSLEDSHFSETPDEIELYSYSPTDRVRALVRVYHINNLLRRDHVSVLSSEASHCQGIDAPNLLLQPSSDSGLPLLSMTASFLMGKISPFSFFFFVFC
ncbi:kinase family protein [Striga asiatica]|uniref:Kinase family protein n=1 Tax=Striga asiatica TaxID=4170 RepID=A0A5A7PEP6_STRAF|nr:kinase family protein [Striga asiatica]